MSQDRTRRGGMPLIFSISIVIQLIVFGAFWFIEPLRKSTMSVDKQELDERTAEVKERSRQREEQERKERAEREIRDEHKEALRKEEERKRRRKIVEKIEEMERIQKEMEELKEERLVEIEQRTLDELMEEKVEDLKKELNRLEHELKQVDQKLPEDKRDQLPKLDQLREQAKQLEQQAKQAVEEPSAENLQQLAEQARAMERETEQLKRQAHEQLAEEGVQKEVREDAKDADQAADRVASLAKDLQQLNPEQMNDTSAARQQEDLAQVDPEQASTAELYEHAAALEQRVAEDFAAARAAELAKINRESFQEAFDKVNSTAHERPDLASELQNNSLDTVQDLNAFRETLDQAVNQTTQMWQHAQNMMQTASGQMGQQAQNQPSQQQQMALAQAFASSAESKGQNRVTDLSQMMRYQGGGFQTDGSQTGREARAGGEGFLPSPTSYEIKGLGNTQEIIAMALPGRKFSKESARQGWLYVDTWYVIGPFENKGRIDWSTIHPPETLIDFDATYPGKGDHTLSWQFSQYNTVRITPPDEVTNATYYAYTEVYFEEESDMLLAIASDDAAKVWINETLAWQDTGLSAWKLDEGFRKVYFKQGFNKILIRIEQGPGVCHWSVLLCPPDL